MREGAEVEMNQNAALAQNKRKGYSLVVDCQG